MMRKMNIYNKIKNPLDSDKLLKKIVEVFLSSNSQDEMYSNAVEYGEKDCKFNEREFYRFKRMIDKQELNNIRSFKRKEVKKDNIKAKLANFVKSDGILSHIKKVNLAALDYLRFNPPTYKMYEYVKNHTNNEILNKYEIDEDKYLRIKEGLRKVVTNGTATFYINKSLNGSGKTGTSETYYNGVSTYTKSFIAYVPSDNPKYAITIISPNISYKTETSTYKYPINSKLSRNITNILFEN